jgi:hypothetical protein
MKHSSQLCIEITTVTQTGGQEMTQQLFATDLYVYGEAFNRQFIFFPEKEAYYLINNGNERLIKVDMSAQAAQFSQVQQQIGELSIEEKEIDNHKQLFIANVNRSLISLNMEAEIKTFAGLEQTVLANYMSFQSASQMVAVKLNANEITAFSKTTLTWGGKTQEIITKLVDIKTLDNPCAFDRYLDFKIDETAAV